MVNNSAKSAGGALGEYGYRQNVQSRSFGEVIKDVFGNIQEIVRSEIRLAQAETREGISRTVSSAKLLGIGAGLALFSAGFLLVSLTQLLALLIPAWAACLVMGVALGIAGYALITTGRKRLTALKAPRTVESLKENAEWMKDRTRS